jgi:hypothetical protein
VQFHEEAAKKAALAMNKKQLDGLVLSILPSKFPAIVESPAKAAGKGDDDDYGHYGPQTGAPPGVGSGDDAETGGGMHQRLPMGDGRRKRGAAFEMSSTDGGGGTRLVSQSHSAGNNSSEGETQMKPAVVSQLQFRPRSLPKKP